MTKAKKITESKSVALPPTHAPLKLFMLPDPRTTPNNNGVGQVIAALYKHMPALGIEFVFSPQEADVIATHIHKQSLSHIDVLHCHGLEWTGDANIPGYTISHHETNRAIADAARSARVITVPSQWVAETFRRDMRIEPEVIGHGIEINFPNPVSSIPDDPKAAYILWNKNRVDGVCDVTPALELAKRGLPIVSTFGNPKIMQRVTGVLPHSEMTELVANAGMYLATTKETFGIGTLEALKAGVPVLGYAWGGNLDIIQHKVNGYLAKPGDIDDLVTGYNWILANYEEVANNAWLSVENFDVTAIAKRYAQLYRRIWAEKQLAKTPFIAVVVTAYNYGQYLETALDSLEAQTRKPNLIIVVDDCSTDDTMQRMGQLREQAKFGAFYTRNEKNQGVAYSRNYGIKEVGESAQFNDYAARDTYVICLDADDWLAPTYIEKCANFLQANPDVGIAYSNISLHHPSGDVSVSGGWPPAMVEFEKVAIDGSVPPANGVPSAAMFRYDAWLRSGRGYVQEHAPGEDAEFWLKILASGYRAVKATAEPLFHYRLHGDSASKTKTYHSVTEQHPWAKDKFFPFAAPISDSYQMSQVRSYSDPLVSIVIPVGPNHAQFLPTALDSLLAQTFRNWEVIIVDDTNGIVGDAKNLASIRQSYPFIKVAHVPQSSKHGAGAARNFGLAHANVASSKFVLWLDADDWLAPTALADMLVAYSKTVAAGANISYVYTDWYIAHASGEMQYMGCLEYSQQGWLEKPRHAVTALIDIEVARQIPFDETVLSWEDWFYFAEFAVKGYCGLRVPKPLLYYRLHTGTRREIALANSSQLHQEFNKRFDEYRPSAKKEIGIAMAGCCGGRGVVAAVVQEALSAEQQAAIAAQAKEKGLVPMLYIGANIGAYADRINGREYRGANTELERHAFANPADVDRLVQTGRWQIAN